eukprot:COSAG04_NODE_1633_length_6104_cov_3.956536_1_plen_213_part_00
MMHYPPTKRIRTRICSASLLACMRFTSALAWLAIASARPVEIAGGEVFFFFLIADAKAEPLNADAGAAARGGALGAGGSIRTGGCASSCAPISRLRCCPTTCWTVARSTGEELELELEPGGLGAAEQVGEAVEVCLQDHRALVGGSCGRHRVYRSSDGGGGLAPVDQLRQLLGHVQHVLVREVVLRSELPALVVVEVHGRGAVVAVGWRWRC